jgi:hypothetical protein
MQSAFERFWPWLFRVEAESFMIITASTVRVPHVVLGLHIIIL